MVYLIHFEQPISEHHTTQHYLGYAKNLKSRIAEHKAGMGARLCKVALERGIGFEVVRTWEGGRELERKLKKRKNAPCLCPICSARK
jgi:predicted GIY-YIG superfamily endonuclease